MLLLLLLLSSSLGYIQSHLYPALIISADETPAAAVALWIEGCRSRYRGISFERAIGSLAMTP